MLRPATYVFVLGLAAAVGAQDPADKLQSLLQELSTLDAKTWAARKAALEQKAKAEDARAAELRSQATKLQEQAAAADAAAKSVRVEIAKLEQLQKLLQGAPPKSDAPAGKPEAPKAEPGKVEPAKAAPAKAMPATAAPATGDGKHDLAAGPLITWKSGVEQLFAERCTTCHEPGAKKGGLDLTSFAAARQGGGSGRTLVAGDPDHSRMWLMVSLQERPFMPKDDAALAGPQLQLLRTWIEQGACEDDASARAFVQAKAAANKADAAAPAVAAAPGAMPVDLPPLPLNTAARPSAVKCLARSPAAELLAMPGLHQVLLFDVELHLLAVLPCEQPHLECLGFAADGSLLAVGAGQAGKHGVALLYDVRSGKQLGCFGDERDVPLAVAVHSQLGLVALGGAGKKTHVLRTKDGSEVFAGAHDDFVLALQFSPDGALLAAADRSGTVHLFETATGRIGQTLTGHRGAVNAVAFAGNGKLLATAGADGTVRGFDVATGKETWKQTPHQGEATALAFSPTDLLASAGADGRIAVLARDGKPVQTSNPVGEWLYSLAFGAGDVVFAGDWQGRVHRFDSGKKQLTASAPLAAPTHAQ